MQAQGGAAGAAGEQQQQQQGQWQASAGDGGHLSAEGGGKQSGSPEYRERGPMDGGLRAAGETKGVRCAQLGQGQCSEA